MSISDESFPDEYDLIGSDNAIKIEEKCSSVALELPGSSLAAANSTLLVNYGDNISFSAAGNSSSGSPDKFSSDCGNSSKRDLSSDDVSKFTIDCRRFKKRALSCHDLHSNYSKRKYAHVESRVKQYIASIKSQFRPKANFIRHKSLPETLSLDEDADGEKHLEENYYVRPDTNNNEISRIRKQIQVKDREIIELQSINETLKHNLDDKVALVARLKRNTETLRIELDQMKEKDRRSGSSAVVGIASKVRTAKKSTEVKDRRTSVTIATQTSIFDDLHFEDVPLDSSSIHDMQNILVNDAMNTTSSTELYTIRRRTNSNSAYKWQFSSTVENLNLSHSNGVLPNDRSPIQNRPMSPGDREVWTPVTVKYRHQQSRQTRKDPSKRKHKGFFKFMSRLVCCSKTASAASTDLDEQRQEYHYTQIPVGDISRHNNSVQSSNL